MCWYYCKVRVSREYDKMEMQCATLQRNEVRYGRMVRWSSKLKICDSAELHAQRHLGEACFGEIQFKLLHVRSFCGRASYSTVHSKQSLMSPCQPCHRQYFTVFTMFY